MTSRDKQIAITFSPEEFEDIKARCEALTPDTAEAVVKPTQYLRMLYLRDVKEHPLRKGRFA